MNSATKFAVRFSSRQASRRPLFRRCGTTTRSSSTTTTIGIDANASSENGDGNGTSMEIAKTRLARAALKQVPRYGWTKDAIAIAASQDPKLSISMSGMFSPSELVGWFMDDMNRQLRNTSKSKINCNNNNNNNDNNQQFESIKWRLEQVLPFVESGQWHKGMAMGLATPTTTRSQLHEFIVLISPENSGATYQTALGAIFVATELHLLTDSSPNYSETWSFLKDRLNELEDDGKNVDPARFLLKLASSTPVPSLASLGTMTNSIPVVAGVAVAQSLLEGAASLVLPQSFRVLPPQGATTNATRDTPSQSMAGTKASDYESPSSSSSSSSR